MATLEYLQKQLQREYYSVTLNDEDDLIEDDLANRSPIYLTDDDSFDEKLAGHSEHKMLFDKVISNYHKSNDWKYSYRREMQEIVPGLFLGGYVSANKSKKSYLLKHGITHIICIRDEIEAAWIKPQHAQEFNYLTLTIDDTFSQSIIPFFELTNRFILDALRNNGRVLVHSNAGISRSATIVIAFVMFYFNCSSKKALTFVQNFRFCIFPNEHFRIALLEYEPILAAKCTKRADCMPLHRKRSFSEESQSDHGE